MGYEAIATLPYAYWAHVNGQLEGTRSGAGSGAFYYFSPDHEINPEPRDYANTVAAAKVIPNMWIHVPRLDKSKWIPPPLKAHYKPRAITFEKPTVVICNRYNREWNREPINYFDLETLRAMFTMLQDKYSIVYVNVRGREELEDNAHSMDLGDYTMIAQEFQDVMTIHQVVDAESELNGYEADFNDVQCRVFAGCEKFITMNGGHSILCSYFGGENIIYTEECKEIRSNVNSFYGWYHDLGGSHVRVEQRKKGLLERIKTCWVDEEVLLNIIVRCHQRPKGLQRLLASIPADENIRIIASFDDKETEKYLTKHAIERVDCTGIQEFVNKPPSGPEYGKFFLPNLYLNRMMERVRDGYVMFMDDDDEYLPGATKMIRMAAEKDSVLLWRVESRSGALIPSDENFAKSAIVAGDISGLGFAFYYKYIRFAQWEQWRRGDYRVIKSLEIFGVRWLNHVLCRMAERIDNVGKQPLDVAAFKANLAKRAAAINETVRLKKEERAADKTAARPNGGWSS